MRANPQRLAWTVLLISFCTCVGLATAVPLGIRHYVLYAREMQQVTLEVHRGPLRVTMAGRGEAVAIAEERDHIPERTLVVTDATAGRLVMHTPQEDSPVVASVQLYDRTEVVLLSARSPRFPASRLPHEVRLEIASGRARINVSSDDGRDTVVTVQTPHGTVTLMKGSYDIQVDSTTGITVRHGQAQVTGLATPIGPDECAVMDGQQTSGPLPAALNLIANGDFRAPLENGWASYTDQENDPPGSISIVTDEGREVANFHRSGSDHAEVGIRQEINHEAGDFASLELHLAVCIREHNVPVCGMYGSECPVMVRVVYEDANGAEQEWLQGFYAVPNTGASTNPSVCTTCSTRNPHIQVQEGDWYFYLSPNLIPLLSQDGQAPTTVESITIYASGHAYDAMVTEVELIGYE